MTMLRGSVEDTTAYATTNSTGYAESVLGAGIGSNGKVLAHCHLFIPFPIISMITVMTKVVVSLL